MAELEDIIRKVQGLISRADHPNTGVHEANACRAKAEILMARYRIAETAIKPGEVEVLPKWATFTVAHNGEFAQAKRAIVSALIDHFECRGIFQLESKEDGLYWVADLCGYPSDLRFLEVLATSCLLAFSKLLEPVHDPDLSEQVNAYIMRKAGMEGIRIASAIYGRPMRLPADKSKCVRVRKLFRAEAELRGEDPGELLGNGNNVGAYRKSYADGFVATLWGRLLDMRHARTGAGLVFVGRKEAVTEAFYTKYPQYRPQPKGTPRIGTGRDTCAKCAKAQSGYCRDHSYLRPRRAQKAKVHRAGYVRGSEAARSVDLGEGRKEIR